MGSIVPNPYSAKTFVDSVNTIYTQTISIFLTAVAIVAGWNSYFNEYPPAFLLFVLGLVMLTIEIADKSGMDEFRAIYLPVGAFVSVVVSISIGHHWVNSLGDSGEIPTAVAGTLFMIWCVAYLVVNRFDISVLNVIGSIFLSSIAVSLLIETMARPEELEAMSENMQAVHPALIFSMLILAALFIRYTYIVHATIFGLISRIPVIRFPLFSWFFLLSAFVAQILAVLMPPYILIANGMVIGEVFENSDILLSGTPELIVGLLILFIPYGIIVYLEGLYE